MKLREFIQQRDDTKFRLEVYRQIFIFLQEFISTDNREERKSIESEGQFVPDYILEEIIEHIEKDHINDLEAKIKEFEEKTI